MWEFCSDSGSYWVEYCRGWPKLFLGNMTCTYIEVLLRTPCMGINTIMAMNSMKNIVKSENGKSKFGWWFVQFWGIFHFFPKWKGRIYFFHNGKKLWLLLSMEKICHPWIQMFCNEFFIYLFVWKLITKLQGTHSIGKMAWNFLIVNNIGKTRNFYAFVPNL